MQNIYNIPANLPFAENFAQGLIKRYQNNLPDIDIYLPTRRAIKSLEQSFAKLQNQNTILLPNIYSLADAPQDEMDFAQTQILTPYPDLLQPIGKQERLFLLAQLVQKFPLPESKLSAANILTLARTLGDFLDMMHIAEIPLEALDDLCPLDYAEHWQRTLKFLDIIKIHMPNILKNSQKSDIMEFQNNLLAKLGEFLKNQNSNKHIIIAGTTGTRSAVRKFAKIISKLQNGAIILPGLDTIASNEDAEAFLDDASHPQYNLMHLLKTLETERTQIKIWHSISENENETKKMKFISSAMRSSKVKKIQTTPIQYEGELPLYPCENEEEEARLIAYHMRETLETPNKTAALITPSRRLSVKVATELKRWNVSVDVSAGQLLSQSLAGQFLKLIADLAGSNLRPLKLLALLQHPLTACQMPKKQLRQLTALLELHLLRGHKPDKGFAGLRKKLTEAKMKPYNKITPEIENELNKFINTIETHLSQIIELQKKQTVNLKEILHEHIKIAENLATTNEETGANILWKKESGIKLAQIIKEALQHADSMPPMLPADYHEFFNNFIAAETFSEPYSYHPRLFIWGTLEARLQTADLIILGGLNEEVWPQSLPADAWMSAGMREKCGLPPLEQRIGLGAHDFCQALCSAKQTILTYAKKRNHTPMSPARWIERIQANLNNNNQNQNQIKNYWNKLLNGTAPASIMLQRPQFAPPKNVRPKKLSVTRFSIWRKDPYAIYTQKILNLNALDTIEKPREANAKGTLIHKILEIIISENQQPNEALFEKIAKIELDKTVLSFRERIIIEHKLKAIGKWFVNKQKSSEPITDIKTEIPGKMLLPELNFEINGKADRIDFNDDNNCHIIDYKSGANPIKKHIIEALDMQLPLEAWMAQQGAFCDKPLEVKSLQIWRVAGQFDPFTEQHKQGGEVSIDITDQDLSEAIENNKNTALKLIKIFADPSFAYCAFPDTALPPKKDDYNDYAYFERLDEWAIHE